MPNRVIRWIRSGVQACMSCVIPPKSDVHPPEKKKRSRRRWWMIRRNNKVGVAETITRNQKKKDAKPKSDKTKGEKSNDKDPSSKSAPKRPLPPSLKKTKVKINPNCKECINKEHSPRKIKARLSAKIQATRCQDQIDAPNVSVHCEKLVIVDLERDDNEDIVCGGKENYHVDERKEDDVVDGYEGDDERDDDDGGEIVGDDDDEEHDDDKDIVCGATAIYQKGNYVDPMTHNDVDDEENQIGEDKIDDDAEEIDDYAEDIGDDEEVDDDDDVEEIGDVEVVVDDDDAEISGDDEVADDAEEIGDDDEVDDNAKGIGGDDKGFGDNGHIDDDENGDDVHDDDDDIVCGRIDKNVDKNSLKIEATEADISSLTEVSDIVSLDSDLDLDSDSASEEYTSSNAISPEVSDIDSSDSNSDWDSESTPVSDKDDTISETTMPEYADIVAGLAGEYSGLEAQGQDGGLEDDTAGDGQNEYEEESNDGQSGDREHQTKDMEQEHDGGPKDDSGDHGVEGRGAEISSEDQDSGPDVQNTVEVKSSVIAETNVADQAYTFPAAIGARSSGKESYADLILNLASVIGDMKSSSSSSYQTRAKLIGEMIGGKKTEFKSEKGCQSVVKEGDGKMAGDSLNESSNEAKQAPELPKSPLVGEKPEDFQVIWYKPPPYPRKAKKTSEQDTSRDSPQITSKQKSAKVQDDPLDAIDQLLHRQKIRKITH